MEINRITNMDAMILSTASSGEMVQNEIQVKLLKESMDFAKDITAKLLESIDVGQHIDIMA